MQPAPSATTAKESSAVTSKSREDNALKVNKLNKPLPSPGSNSSSTSSASASSFTMERFRRKSSSDVTQSDDSSADPMDSKTNQAVAGVRNLFRSRSKAPAGQPPSPVISPGAANKVNSTAPSTRAIARSSQIEAADREASVTDGKITLQEIYRQFSTERDLQNPLNFVLYRLYKLIGQATVSWEKNEWDGFEKEKGDFDKSMLGFQKAIAQPKRLIKEESDDQNETSEVNEMNEITPQELLVLFEKEPPSFNDCKNDLDQVVHHLYNLGRLVIAASKNHDLQISIAAGGKGVDLQELIMSKTKIDESIILRFQRVIIQEQKRREIEAFKVKIGKAFLTDGKITLQEIYRQFKPKIFIQLRAIKGDQQYPLIRVLYHLSKLIRQAKKSWKKTEWNRFEKKRGDFDKSMRQFQKAVVQPKRVIKEESCGVRKKTSDVNEITPQEVLELFEKEPPSFNDCKNALDQVVHHLYNLGRQAIAALRSNDLQIAIAAVGKSDDLQKLLMNKTKIDESIIPRFQSVIIQEQRRREIEACKVKIEKAFLEDVEQFLTENVFLALDEPFNSKTNRRILEELIKLIPDAKSLVEEMDAAERASGQLVKPGGKASAFAATLKSLGSFKHSDESSDEKLVKLKEDYAFLVRAYKLCEILYPQYCSALRAICVELEKPALWQEELPSTDIVVKGFMDLIHHHLEASRWATINMNPNEVKKAWLAKVCARIKFRELPVVEKGFMDIYRSLLVENMRVRPCKIQSFDKELMSLRKRLIEKKIHPARDVPRAFNVEGHVSCFFNGEEVQMNAVKTNKNDAHLVNRYVTCLLTFSKLFANPEMFLFFATELKFPMIASSSVETEYEAAYHKLFDDPEKLFDIASNEVKSEEEEKLNLKQTFEECFGPGHFETVFKFFRLSQNIFAQRILYYFSDALMLARQEKFNLKRKGLRVKDGSEEKSGDKKNEYIINVNGSYCEITIIRYEHVLIDVKAPLRQEYKIAFDVKSGEIFLPCQDQVSLKLTCPAVLERESEEIRELLFVFPLIAESLDFPLEIIRT